ncbi:hypothetical protein KsCSTR_09310 [Candidatus Kuenenia stuttgartiensis]|jgi:hypothetical protein|uniref:Uncharacterized protein n=1 Tax=Kuenenia stuttgartiensis TaxID=174633 RepID=A0A2C9CDY7_KUEST|nr:hypothetical protein [Candidatus Kuenenia stuttgartiensis]MBW7942599.1 hypothetical protein [Candidatus Kuenenia stuttgartiensis]MBZ0191163.1 hypothetical protein [Candidatus Kuenenia stuttgartiensis]QII10310.1 hypothetical protein KsCSTR_09310 [Candidatus Kuenenia stuttgartiensis]SOH03855.1 hypothetical protein KSMBR1_1355 [Candidatus Kuenenia stuttgartiensis]
MPDNARKPTFLSFTSAGFESNPDRVLNPVRVVLARIGKKNGCANAMDFGLTTNMANHKMPTLIEQREK